MPQTHFRSPRSREPDAEPGSNRVVVALLATFWLLAGALHAQDGQAAGDAQGAEALGARITTLEALATPDADQAAELALLKTAVESLQQVESSQASTSKLVDQASTAGDLLTKAKANLEQATTDAKAPLVLELAPAPAGGTADELTAALAPVEAALQSAQAKQQAAQQVLEQAKQDAADAETRNQAIPGEIADATAQKQNVDPLVAGITPDPNASSLQQAQNASLRARQRALTAKLAERDQELKTLAATKELRKARIDLAQARVDAAARVTGALQKELDARRLLIASKGTAEADQASRGALSRFEVVRTILEANAALAAENEDLAKRQKSWNEERERVKNLALDWEATFDRTRSQVRRVGLNDAMGLRLRNLRVQLLDLGSFSKKSGEVWTEVGRAQTRSIQLETQEIDDPEAEAQLLLSRSKEALPAGQRDQILKAIETGLASQQVVQRKLQDSYDTYTDNTLLALHDDLEVVADLRGEFLDYIQERVLWIQSAAPIGIDDIALVGRSIAWFFGSEQWGEVVAAIGDSVSANPARAALLFLPFVLLVGFQRLLRRRLGRAASQVTRAATDRFSYTLEASLITVLLALWLPAIFWAFEHLLGRPDVDATFASSCAYALEGTLPVLLSVTLALEVCRKKGLAEAHFGWPAESLGLVRGMIRVVGVFAVSTGFFVRLTETEAFHLYHDSLGRLAFCASSIAIAYSFWRVMSPTRGIPVQHLVEQPEGWLARLRPVWFPLLVTLPVGFGIAACAGYFLTARELALRLLQSLWIFGAGVVVFHLLLRMLFVVQRRQAFAKLALRMDAQREAAQQAAGQADQEGGHDQGVTPIPVDEKDLELDVKAVNEQTRRMVGSALTVGVLVCLYFVWAAMLPALQVFDAIAVWTPHGAVATVGVNGNKVLPAGAITVADLGLALLLLLATFQVARNLPGTLEIVVLRLLPLSPGARYTIRTLSRYAIVTLGLVLTFDAIGIGWEKVQWLAAAVSVGLGFGLQEIFANFVSGLIILTERPIRLGDTVTVSGVSGTVARIQMRATTVTDWDRKELIIPNKAFVTGEIVNWTLSNAVTRICLDIGVAYGSDTEAAKRIMLEVAAAEELVLDDPQPRSFFIKFGDNSLEFQLRIYIDDVDDFSMIRDRVNMALDREFRKAGIEIAFPQRDLHLRSIDVPLPFTRDGEPLLQTAARDSAVPAPIAQPPPVAGASAAHDLPGSDQSDPGDGDADGDAS